MMPWIKQRHSSIAARQLMRCGQSLSGWGSQRLDRRAALLEGFASLRRRYPQQGTISRPSFSGVKISWPASRCMKNHICVGHLVATKCRIWRRHLCFQGGGDRISPAAAFANGVSTIL